MKRTQLPDIHTKAFVFGPIGAGIGAGVGALLGNSPFYAGIGAAFGFILFGVIALFFAKNLPLHSLSFFEQKSNFISVIISLILSILSVIFFIQTRKVVFLIGIVFFGIGGIYLLFRRKS